MGTYFNPDNGSFKQDIRSMIYVDKTGLLNELNKVIGTPQKCIAVSHARRFGKSQAAGMIDAYYSKGSDSKALFSQFEIAKAPDFEEHLNQYNVVHLDISSFWDDYKDNIVEKIKEYLFNEFRQDYPETDDSKRITSVLQHIYISSGASFVIIIDEWDCVIRNAAHNEALVHQYMQFLHSLFKSEESKQFLALGYITGILPIKKVQDESALNNFSEYTMIQSYNLTTYYGFTESEVHVLCDQYNMNYDTIRQWYDGYLINGQHMYNPNSVVQAMRFHSTDSFWKNTSAFSTINNYIALDYKGLKEDVLHMLSGGKTKVRVSRFTNDLSEIHSKDDALTALIHLGYLGYDKECESAFIPNYEVLLAFQDAIETGEWTDIAETLMACDDLLRTTINGNAEKVAELLQLSHETYTSILKYNDENSLSCAITMAYFTAPAYYQVIREFPTGKGFADIVMLPRKDAPNKPAMIIELKWNQSADTAIRQIKEKRYTRNLSDYKEVLLVGISYDKDSDDKTHHCVIERYAE